MGRAPSVIQHIRQTIGRALRETGQALDRLGVKTAMFSATKHDYYDDPVIFEDHLSRHRHQFPMMWSGRPLISQDVAFLAPCSTLIGSVRIGANSSVWYGAVLRADECLNADEEEEEWEVKESRYRDRIDHHGGGIFIGDDTNIQDGCIITSRVNHCKLGNGVTVGHLAQIHSATVEDFCLIGMGSILQEGVLVETEAFIAAGAVVPAGQVVKSGELWIGNPARKLRDLTLQEREKL
jgi:carbonic anhydrase/acetyltransferase-like protein (isoleucine patch superfamily)